MLTNLGSQWFLAGASLICVLQQIQGVNYHPNTALQLEASRANLAFLSALFSVAGMGLALGLKFVDIKADEREEENIEELEKQVSHLNIKNSFLNLETACAQSRSTLKMYKQCTIHSHQIMLTQLANLGCVCKHKVCQSDKC